MTDNMMFFICCIFGVIAVAITWIIAPFFLAKRQYYVKSQYELLKLKIGWCITWFFCTTFLCYFILLQFL